MPIVFNRRQNQQKNLYLPSWSHRSTTKIGVPTPSHEVPTTTRQFIPTRRIKFQQLPFLRVVPSLGTTLP
jgi:hypothetical protein